MIKQRHSTMSRRRRAQGTRRSGLTLIEVTIASILVGTILAASMRTAGSVLRFRSQSSDSSRAALLADDLLNEILALPYIDQDETAVFGYEPSESAGRTAFDDVDDYHNWIESPPVLKTGAALPDHTGWERSVSVAYALRTDPSQSSGSDQSLKRITVTVRKDGVVRATADALKVDF
jgi:Tfp pilus assembly protein PilV